MTTTKATNPRVTGVGSCVEPNKWIVSLKVMRGRDMFWLVGNRPDRPEERDKLRDELQAKLAKNGIKRFGKIEFIVEDDTPLVRNCVRRELISAFKKRQETDHEYLSLEKVSSEWAPMRSESPLSEAKEVARTDLMEAAFCGRIPQLLRLQPVVPLEYAIDPSGKLFDPVTENGGLAYLDAASLDEMLDLGALPREAMKTYLIKEMGPHCWARREAVVSFLLKRKVNAADLPPAWLKDLPANDTNVVTSHLTMVEVSLPAAKKTKLSKSQAREAYKARRAQPEFDDRAPTNEEDRAWRESSGVSRAVLRKLRQPYTNNPPGKPRDN